MDNADCLQEVCSNTYDKACGRSEPGVPRKHLIENAVNSELERLVDSTNVLVVDKWYLNHMVTSEDIPNSIIRSLSLSEAYINIMESHIATMIEETRKIIQKKKETVMNKLVKRKKNIEARKKREPEDETKEMRVLRRMQYLPDDLIRYISEFAFTPGIRVAFIQAKYNNIIALFSRIKSPNLKNMIPAIYNINSGFIRLIAKLDSTKCLSKYKALPGDAVYEAILYVRYFRMNRTDTKRYKLALYLRLLKSYEDIIAYYKQFVTVSYKKMQNLLIQFYNTAVYVASHNCNKRIGTA
jgi:hypothetical protein